MNRAPFKGLLCCLLGAVLPAVVAQATPYSDAVIADNPLAYYRFSETSGSTAFSEMGNNGSYNGAANPNVPGFISAGFGFDNSASRYDGSSAFVNTPVSMTGLGAFTIEAWVNPAAAQGNRTGLVGQNDAYEFGFINANTIELWNPGVGALQTAYDTGANAGKWVHIVATGNGTQKNLYLNGNLVATQNHGATADYANGNANFLTNIGGGGIQDGSGNFFNGDIDEVAVYSHALNAQQVMNHYYLGISGAPVPTGTMTVPGTAGGKISGTALGIDAMTGDPTGAPVAWKLEHFAAPQAGLQTQWYANTGDLGLGGIDGFFAGNPATSVPVFVSPQVAFGGPVGFPTEITNAGLQGSGNRTVRFSGQIFIPESGTYNFKDGVDQTTRLIIGGQTVIADSLWAGFDGSGGDNGGSAINAATFNVAAGGEWLDFEFVMSENCCGNQASLFWDYDPNNGGLGGNTAFPTANTQPAGLAALVPGTNFRFLPLLDAISGVGPYSGVFMDANGNMITIDLSAGELARLTVQLGNDVFSTTQFEPAIPEPATASLLLVAAAGLVRRRRRAA